MCALKASSQYILGSCCGDNLRLTPPTNCNLENVVYSEVFKRSCDLRDPEGPLNKELDPYTIRLVNEKVKSEIEKSHSGKREPYVRLTPLQKALIR